MNGPDRGTLSQGISDRLTVLANAFGLRGFQPSREYKMKVLFVHPSPLMYSKIYLRLEPLGLELGDGIGAAGWP